MLEIHRTHRAKILNHGQVAEMLDRRGWSASKLWNVANYHSSGFQPQEQVVDCKP